MRRISFYVVVVLGCWLGLTGQSPLARGASSNLDLARQLNEAFVEVAEKVSPAVVVITVVQKPSPPAKDQEGEKPPSWGPREFYRFFHEEIDPAPEDTQGQGSGLIIRDDGYILTNSHVVENPERIEVRLRDGRVFKAALRGIDLQSDIAVLKIEAQGLPIAMFGDSSKARVGEFAIAIGAPFNLDYSVTFGHVSAKGRSNLIEGYEGRSLDQDYIQTDATINPGNSGGPLVNINGEVIGINSLIRGLHTGIGFAIPSNLAKEISEQLIIQGKFTRAWLGVGIRAFSDVPQLKDSLKGVDDGVVVLSIEPGGPAAKSDLKTRDVITAIDGTRVGTPQQLRNQIRGKPLDQPVILEVFRPTGGDEGKRIEVKIKPAEWIVAPPIVANAKDEPVPERTANPLGLTVHSLTRGLAERFGVDVKEGVLVMAVEKETPAARQGIKPGDIITSVDKQSVGNPKQFRDALKKADLKKGVMLNLLSGNTARFEILKADEN
jgi:serine protease Do